MPRGPNKRIENTISPPAGAKWISLTKNKYALVDEDDYNKVMEHNWCVCNGYAAYAKYINKKYVFIKMHRFILNAPDDKHVDHINGDTLDNRKSNLRLCSHFENSKNQKKRTNKTTSQFKGVHFWKRDNNWRASIKLDGKTKHIGYFDTEEAAAKAYDIAAIQYYKEFAKTNFSKENYINVNNS